MEAIPMPTATLIYEGIPTRGIDGDTFALNKKEEIRVRLIGVNTPELYRGDEAQRTRARAARDYTASFLTEGNLIIRSFGKDSFGRDLALVWRVKDGILLNRELIVRGLGDEVPIAVHLTRHLSHGTPLPRDIKDPSMRSMVEGHMRRIDGDPDEPDMRAIRNKRVIEERMHEAGVMSDFPPEADPYTGGL